MCAVMHLASHTLFFFKCFVAVVSFIGCLFCCLPDCDLVKEIWKLIRLPSHFLQSERRALLHFRNSRWMDCGMVSWCVAFEWICVYVIRYACILFVATVLSFSISPIKVSGSDMLKAATEHQLGEINPSLVEIFREACIAMDGENYGES